ncbi:MAG: hypothetical protein IKT16_00500 [Desulfovibrio sp.]|nr:hypothetical protein [Desulfovibrio sp.]
MDRLKAYYPEQAVLDLLSEPDGRHGRRLRAALADTYGIRIREYSDRYVLNYSQIGSARHSFEPVVRVCRQLIVRRDLTGILHRSFDRFYNYREDPDSDAFDAAKAVCEEKLDGSLVGVYHDGTAWRHCTRSLAYAEGTMDACLEYRSFGELLDSEVDLSPVYEQGDPALSYLFELVSRFDPHVSKASGPRLYLLAARNKRSGEYADADAEARRIGWPWRPKTYAFGSLQELRRASGRCLPQKRAASAG